MKTNCKIKSCRLLLLCLAIFLWNGLMAGETIEGVLKNQGIERTYKLYLPDNLKADAPLVIVLHGHGGTAMQSGQGMCKVADEEGFAVCFPQGTSLSKREKPSWNVGYPFQDEMKVNDVEFLCKLAADLQKKYGLSRKNVFCTGMSNGGEMCYLLAYLKPDVFAAVAPIAGLTMEWMYRELVPKKHIPLMEVHGTKDKTSLWNGDLANVGGWGAYIAVPLAVNLWAVTAKCTHEEIEELPLLRNKVTLHKYVGGKPAWKNGPATEVWLYEISNGGHNWGDKDLNTYMEIWRFFKKYLR